MSTPTPPSSNEIITCDCAIAPLPPPLLLGPSLTPPAEILTGPKSQVMPLLRSASKLIARVLLLFFVAATCIVFSQLVDAETNSNAAVHILRSFQPSSNADPTDQQPPCLLDVASQSILSPDGTLASGVKFSALLRAVVEEYMSDKVDVSTISEMDDDGQYHLLEVALRRMQLEESRSALYLPTSTSTPGYTAAAAASKGPLAGVTYTRLRKAILKDYFASAPERTDPWKQLTKALEVMQKVEIDGVPVQIEGYPYLYIGSAGAAYNFASLWSTGITHILNTSPSVIVRFQGVFQYMHIDDVYDRGGSSESLARYFPSASEFIDEARKSGGKVLVHCRKGKSRSASLLAAYLMQYHGFTRDPALALIRRTRPITKPSPNFMADLEDFERDQLKHEADDDTPLPKGAVVLSENGSLVGDAKYSTIRRAVVGEYVDPETATGANPWEMLNLGLEAMQMAELMNDNGTKQCGPLAGVTYSQLEEAVLNHFNQYFAASSSSPDDKPEQLRRALWVMRMIEVDGKPVPIGEDDITAPPTLFIGGSGPAFNIQELKHSGITHIISAIPSIGEVFPQDFTYLHISGSKDHAMPHNTSLYQFFPSTYDFIDNARRNGGKVLVHDKNGANKCTTILAAYLMRKEGLGTGGAVDRINRVRTRARPSKQYWQELKRFERVLKKEWIIHDDDDEDSRRY